MQEENEDEEDLLDQLASVLTAVLRNYGDAALPFLAELMPALGALLEPGRDPEERRIAICILDDILEHCPAGGRPQPGRRSFCFPIGNRGDLRRAGRGSGDPVDLEVAWRLWRAPGDLEGV